MCTKARLEGRDGLLASLTYSHEHADFPWHAAEVRFTDAGSDLKALLERLEPLDIDRDADFDVFETLHDEILELEPRIVWERDQTVQQPVGFNYGGGILRWR